MFFSRNIRHKPKNQATLLQHMMSSVGNRAGTDWFIISEPCDAPSVLDHVIDDDVIRDGTVVAPDEMTSRSLGGPYRHVDDTRRVEVESKTVNRTPIPNRCAIATTIAKLFVALSILLCQFLN